MTDSEIKQAIGGLGDDSAVWRAFMTMVDNAAKGAIEAASLPGLEDHNRQFNAGRQAMILDFAETLVTLKRELKVNEQR